VGDSGQVAPRAQVVELAHFCRHGCQVRGPSYCPPDSPCLIELCAGNFFQTSSRAARVRPIGPSSSVPRDEVVPFTFGRTWRCVRGPSYLPFDSPCLSLLCAGNFLQAGEIGGRFRPSGLKHSFARGLHLTFIFGEPGVEYMCHVIDHSIALT